MLTSDRPEKIRQMTVRRRGDEPTIYVTEVSAVTRECHGKLREKEDLGLRGWKVTVTVVPKKAQPEVKRRSYATCSVEVDLDPLARRRCDFDLITSSVQDAAI